MIETTGRFEHNRNEAHVAQSVEHFLGKEEVMGSIPVVGSRIAAYSVAIEVFEASYK